jgi:hypothetical protein
VRNEPSSPGRKRAALAGWIAAAAVGTLGVWWLSSYIDTLTALAETDREAALALFRSRALPALLLVVAVAVAAGGVLMRQGLQIVRAARENPDVEVEGAPRNAPARLLGVTMAVTGFLMAAMPLVLVAIVFWLLSRA